MAFTKRVGGTSKRNLGHLVRIILSTSYVDVILEKRTVNVDSKCICHFASFVTILYIILVTK